MSTLLCVDVQGLPVARVSAKRLGVGGVLGCLGTARTYSTLHLQLTHLLRTYVLLTVLYDSTRL
jgi:fluoride ion exporter CrcB/FEX